MSNCMKKKKNINTTRFLLRYFKLKDLAIWLDEYILGYNLSTRLFLIIAFALENQQQYSFSFLTIFREN